VRKTCKKCGLTFEPAEAFFSLSRGKRVENNSFLRATCDGCRLNARTERKKQNRPKEKARRSWHYHADKYVKRNMADSRNDFAQRYGWDLDQMAHDIKHAHANGCPYCHQMFFEMEHGLADVTLDIINPDLPPYYETNARWVCMTCNREKQKTSPDLWGAKLQCWKQWREHQEKLKADPFAGLPLFEGIENDIGSKRKLLDGTKWVI
jgi:hypothetical protein